MIRSEDGGAEIEIEIWQLPITEVGHFSKNVKYSLAIEEIETCDNEWVHAFVCDRTIAFKGEEITNLGSWRVFLRNV